MDIIAVNNPKDLGGSANLTQKNPATQPVVNLSTEKPGEITNNWLTAPTDEKVHKKPANLQDVTQMTEAMNKFVQAMDVNIRFTIHEKSNQLMVQVVDQANDKVLKEFPSGEFLDTMAAIRDYVGILLDKKI